MKLECGKCGVLTSEITLMKNFLWIYDMEPNVPPSNLDKELELEITFEHIREMFSVESAKDRKGEWIRSRLDINTELVRVEE